MSGRPGRRRADEEDNNRSRIQYVPAGHGNAVQSDLRSAAVGGAETLTRISVLQRADVRKRLVNRGASAVRSSGIDESLSWSLGSERLPVVRQEFIQAVDGVRRDAREHIVKPGERLKAAPFAGSDKASQYRRRLA